MSNWVKIFRQNYRILLISFILSVVIILISPLVFFKSNTYQYDLRHGIIGNHNDEVHEDTVSFYKDTAAAITNDPLVEGRVAYDVPSSMALLDNYRITVAVSKSFDGAILFQGLTGETIYQKNISLSSLVKLVLVDPTKESFEITPINPSQEQYVGRNLNAIWSWNVRPLRSGSNQLVLQASSEIRNSLGIHPIDIIVFDEKIMVNSSPFRLFIRFVETYWQWIATVIIIPLATLLFNTIKNFFNRPRQANSAGFRIRNR